MTGFFVDSSGLVPDESLSEAFMNSISSSHNKTHCPRWSKCSAPICPLDDQWNWRVMTNSDSVCFYLVESVKRGAEARFRGRSLGHLYELMVEAYPRISSGWSRIRRVLQRSMDKDTRLNAFSKGEAK